MPLTNLPRALLRLGGCLLALCGLLGAAGSALAQPINEALFSPDVSVALGLVDFDDEDVAYEDFNTPISPFVPIPLPPQVDLTAYHVNTAGSGTLYFSLDTTVELAGPLVVTPRDIVAYDFVTFWVALSGASIGVPAGARIDALGQDPSSGLFVASFDTTVELGGTVFADEDLVLLGSPPALYFDGAGAGVPTSLDVDGASVFEGGLTVLSFDGSGVVGGVAFDDEDLLLHSKPAGAWTMAYDASGAAPAMGGGPDTDAVFVPEPGAAPLWLAGSTLLGALGRRRLRRSRTGPNDASPRRSSEAPLSRRAMVRGGRRPVAMLMVPCFVLMASSASAVDGVVEINQAAVAAGAITPGDAPGFPATLSLAGSYVLTGDLVVPDPATTAISVVASDVTLDLGGFAIIGAGCIGATTSACRPASAAGAGVIVDSIPLRHGVAVRNGSITGMGSSALQLGRQAEVTGIRARWNGGTGIYTGTASVVAGCNVVENDAYGVDVGNGSTVRDNVAIGNGEDGLYANPGSLVVDNVVRSNEEAGLYADAGSTVSRNSASINGGGGIGTGAGSIVVDNTSYANTGAGITAGTASLVRGNTVFSNTGPGLSLAASAAYRDNAINANGSTVAGGVNLLGNSCNGAPTCP